MKNLFVPIELAKQLRVKKFKEPCLACYDGADMLSTYSAIFKPLNYNVSGSPTTSAPTYQEVIDWFRFTHGIYIETSLFDDGQVSYHQCIIKHNEDEICIKDVHNPDHSPSSFKLVKDPHTNHKDRIDDMSTCYYYMINKGIEEALKLIEE